MANLEEFTIETTDIGYESKTGFLSYLKSQSKEQFSDLLSKASVKPSESTGLIKSISNELEELIVIHDIQVDLDKRNNGIGKDLANKLIHDSIHSDNTAIIVEVYSDYEQTSGFDLIRFYEELGFKTIQESIFSAVIDEDEAGYFEIIDYPVMILISENLESSLLEKFSKQRSNINMFK